MEISVVRLALLAQVCCIPAHIHTARISQPGLLPAEVRHVRATPQMETNDVDASSAGHMA
jgi:hypothetical protein